MLSIVSVVNGHSNVVITEHYLSGLKPDVTFGINDPILYRINVEEKSARYSARFWMKFGVLIFEI
jgi:hypothetical protein